MIIRRILLLGMLLVCGASPLTLVQVQAASETPAFQEELPKARGLAKLREAVREQKAARLSQLPVDRKKKRLSARLFGFAGGALSIGYFMAILFSDNEYWVYIPALVIAGIGLMILGGVTLIIGVIVSAIEWVGRLFKKKPKPAPEQVEETEALTE